MTTDTAVPAQVDSHAYPPNPLATESEREGYDADDDETGK